MQTTATISSSPSVTTPPAPAWLSRLPGAVLATGCLAVLLVAASLDPDPTGIGTHTQMGFAPCGFEGATGLPCATCGMTTATALAADGRLVASAITQPAGAFFALAMAAGVLLGAWSAIGGWSLSALGRTLWTPRALMALVALAIAAWGYKVLLVFI